MNRRAIILVLALGGIVLLAVGLAGVDWSGGGSSSDARVLTPGAAPGTRAYDPLAYRPVLEPSLSSRASAGFSHVLYEKSPGGAVATARRVAGLRGEVERAAGHAGVNADELEALVFLESAGRSDAIAGTDPANAAGLTQIVAETGRNLLGMKIDLAASRRATRRLRVAKRLQRTDARATALIRRLLRTRTRLPVRAEAFAFFRARDRRAQLRQIVATAPGQQRHADERFVPARALAATGRYLQMARKRFGRGDLAIASYHMGMGNLERVIRAYAGDQSTPIDRLVNQRGISYARLFFDSTPLRHPQAQTVLFSLGDDSATYLWRLRAAQQIMQLYRSDRSRLRDLGARHGAKHSAEEVLHPLGSTRVFDQPGDIEQALASGDLVRFSSSRSYGYARSLRMGELAPRLGQQPSRYAALRPEALALLRYLARGVRVISHDRHPLLVTSTVRDRSYQRLLIGQTQEATRGYSLHTTGYSFDIRRSYASKAQAIAFQYMLDHLQALNLIAWVREPGAIHVTASSEALTLEGATGVQGR